MSIEIPQGDESEYLHALSVAALFVAASPAGAPCVLGYTRDLGQALESIRGGWHWSVKLTHAWWMSDENGARAIVAAVAEAFPSDNGRLDAAADMVAAKVMSAAASAGVVLTPHTTTLERVKVVITHVDGMIAAANASGELRWFNKAYKNWRVTALQGATIGYTAMRSRLRSVIVKRVAQGGCSRIGPELWNEVLRPATENTS